MLSKHLVETIMGGFVLLVAAIFLGFAYVSADLTPSHGYELTARFSAVDGLTVGSDVRIGGVKIGVVTEESVDYKNYRAVVQMNVQSRVRVPVDSKAEIASAGLLGGKYVKIEAGHDTAMLQPGGEIKLTEGSVVLEELLGKIIFLATGDQGGGGQDKGGASAPAAAPETTSPGAAPAEQQNQPQPAAPPVSQSPEQDKTPGTDQNGAAPAK